MSEPIALDAAEADLAADAQAIGRLRRRAQLRLAAHDLLEGVRGIVRAAPLLSVAAGVWIGMGLRRRRRRVRR